VTVSSKPGTVAPGYKSGMEILFVASFAPVVPDPKAAHAFYLDALGLPLQAVAGDYVAVEGFGGTKHLGVWPLADAAEACYGTREWPAGVPVPQASLEFEVADVAAAARELEAAGHTLIHGARTEPWGQEIARLFGPEGLIVGVCSTPWLHDGDAADA
jgi:catechol 2,3-dioxygenase-like lactoylglutathione lyase family enzyme